MATAKVSFVEFSWEHGGDYLHKDRLKEYLAKVLGIPEGKVEKGIIDLILQDINKVSPNPEHPDLLPKKGVLHSIKQYGEYVRHTERVQKMFQFADTSKDGKLQRDELRKMIESYESTKSRESDFCKDVLLFLTEDDLNFILESADADHDGDISPSEVVRAVGAWEELADAKMKEFEKAACCVVS